MYPQHNGVDYRWLVSEIRVLVINKLAPCAGMAVNSSQLTFPPSSKSRDTNKQDKYQKSGPITFRYCTV